MKQIAADYPTNSNPASAEYPGGSIKNESVPGTSGDGTPLDSPIINDYVGFSEALIAAGLVAASGSADTAIASDRLDAIVNLIGIKTLQNLYGIDDSDTFIYGSGLSMVADTTAVIYNDGLYIANSTFTTTGTFATDAGNFDLLRIHTRDIDDATTASVGVIEQATSTEVQNGTPGNLAVTPSGLATRTATTTRTGLVEKATTTEAVNGTTEKYIDASLLQHALLNANGTTDRRNKRNAMGIYDGTIAAGGTSFVVSPGTGWSVAEIGNRRIVTHPLGVSNFRVIATSESDLDTSGEAMVNAYNKTTTTFELANQDAAGNDKEWPINFTVIV